MAGPFGGIAGLFRNTQQVQQVQAPNTQQGNTNAQPNNAPQPNGKPGSTLDPNAGNNQQQGNGQQQQLNANNSPLDAFKDLWKNDPKATDPNADPFSQPLFQTDPAKIREAAGQIDFLAQVPQEMIQKAMAGNDPQAFMSVINAVAQNALATSLHLGTATMEQAGQRIGQRFNSSLPGRVKSLQVQSMAPKNPMLKHPAVQPMLDSVRSRIQAQNPDLAPQEIQQMAEDYFTQMMSAWQTGDPNAAGAGSGQGGEQQQEFDWAAWANPSQGQ
jgi:hypothetical protein